MTPADANALLGLAPDEPLARAGLAEHRKTAKHAQAELISLSPPVLELRRTAAIRGLSCKIGEYHAACVRADTFGTGWATAMLRQMQCRVEAPSQEVA